MRWATNINCDDDDEGEGVPKAAEDDHEEEKEEETSSSLASSSVGLRSLFAFTAQEVDFLLCSAAYRAAFPRYILSSLYHPASLFLFLSFSLSRTCTFAA